MNKLISIFLVLAVCVGGSPARYINRSDLYRLAISPRACAEGTISCSDDCKNVVICSGGTSIVVIQCPGTLYCDPKDFATCSTTNTCQPPTPAINFTCHGTGYFPDPFECTKYHSCIRLGQISAPTTCRSGFAYDPAKFTCSKSLTDRVCREKPIPPCTSLLQKGPQVENPNIYYICLSDGSGNLVPSLYKCPTNEVYQFDKCVNVAITTSTQYTTSPTTTTPTTTTPTTTTPTTTTPTTTTPEESTNQPTNTATMDPVPTSPCSGSE